MDIQRRKPPQKQIAQQGAVQFRKRVFDRSKIDGTNTAQEKQEKASTDKESLFASFRSQMNERVSTVSGGVLQQLQHHRKHISLLLIKVEMLQRDQLSRKLLIRSL